MDFAVRAIRTHSSRSTTCRICPADSCRVQVHPESTLQLAAVINMIREADCSAGVVLNPGTHARSPYCKLPTIGDLTRTTT